MHMQNVVKIRSFVLKILNGYEILSSLRSGLHVPNGCYVTLRATSYCRPQRHLVLTSRLLHLKRAVSEFMTRKALRVCLFVY